MEVPPPARHSRSEPGPEPRGLLDEEAVEPGLGLARARAQGEHERFVVADAQPGPSLGPGEGRRGEEERRQAHRPRSAAEAPEDGTTAEPARGRAADPPSRSRARRTPGRPHRRVEVEGGSHAPGHEPRGPGPGLQAFELAEETAGKDVDQQQVGSVQGAQEGRRAKPSRGAPAARRRRRPASRPTGPGARARAGCLRRAGSGGPGRGARGRGRRPARNREDGRSAPRGVLLPGAFRLLVGGGVERAPVVGVVVLAGAARAPGGRSRGRRCRCRSAGRRIAGRCPCRTAGPAPALRALLALDGARAGDAGLALGGGAGVGGADRLGAARAPPHRHLVAGVGEEEPRPLLAHHGATRAK